MTQNKNLEDLKELMENGGWIIDNGFGAVVFNSILDLIAQARQEERERVHNLILNGGTGDTILVIEKDGEKYINERQLLKAIENL